MKRLLESQKVVIREALTKNAQLVTENSELRMHMSFMPVEYRDYVKNMQTSAVLLACINANSSKASSIVSLLEFGSAPVLCSPCCWSALGAVGGNKAGDGKVGLIWEGGSRIGGAELFWGLGLEMFWESGEGMFWVLGGK
jgi:hypothetical protein